MEFLHGYILKHPICCVVFVHRKPQNCPPLLASREISGEGIMYFSRPQICTKSPISLGEIGKTAAAQRVFGFSNLLPSLAYTSRFFFFSQHRDIFLPPPVFGNRCRRALLPPSVTSRAVKGVAKKGEEEDVSQLFYCARGPRLTSDLHAVRVVKESGM